MQRELERANISNQYIFVEPEIQRAIEAIRRRITEKEERLCSVQEKMNK